MPATEARHHEHRPLWKGGVVLETDPVAQALDHVARLSSGPELDPSVRVTLNFHPDRWVRGRLVVQALAEDGVYRSQFETGTSNGGLTAHPGGDRWRWEQRIFGGAYDASPDKQRPKYGALNERRSPVGGSPRFGSAHLRLNEGVLSRITLCFPDSVFEPTLLGVAASAGVVGQSRLAVPVDPLDRYIEAHVHGVVDLATDVDAVVLDPSFRGSEVEEHAGHLPFPVEWHRGFRAERETLTGHPEYRGQEFAELAGHLLDEDGGRWLTPALIGAASRTGRYDEQALKRVWHLLARFGWSWDHQGLE